MDLLRDTSLTVSEISYRVGFGSTSYFIKCFREQYGFSPGEAAKQDIQKILAYHLKQAPGFRWKVLAAGILIALLCDRAVYILAQLQRSGPGKVDRRITV